MTKSWGDANPIERLEMLKDREERMEQLGEKLRLAYAEHERGGERHHDTALHIDHTPWAELSEERRGKWIAMAEAAYDWFDDHGYFDG